MIAPPSLRKAIWTLAILAVTVAGLAVAVKQDFLKTHPAAAIAQPQVVAFADGGTLEILGTSVGERIVEITPQRRFKIPFLSWNGSSGSTYAGLNIDTELEDGNVIRARLRSPSPRALLMEVRLKDRSGTAPVLPVHLAIQDNHTWIGNDDRISKRGHLFAEFEAKDDRLDTLRAAMTKVGLPLLIQHRDPESGWIHLMGPSMYHPPWPDRYIVALGAWRRDLPSLDFRAIREDGEVVEFYLPNPDFRKSPLPAPLPVTPPFVHTARDFTLAVNGLRRLQTPGNHPLATVDFAIHYKGPPVTGLKEGPISFQGMSQASDEWGNTVAFDRDPHGKKPGYGAFLPLASQRLMLDLTLRRGGDYPYSDRAGVMILDGVVTADGLGIDFQPGPDADLFSVMKLPACRITPAPAWNPQVTKDWQQIELTLECEGGNDQLANLQGRIGDLDRWEPAVFLGDDDTSSGLTSGKNGGHGGGVSFNFERHGQRFFPPGALAPGTKVRIGLHERAQDEKMRFELEMPPHVQPR